MPIDEKSHRPAAFRAWTSRAWLPLLLATIAFFAYWPSLKSDFVYDGSIEILYEGFITSVSNLPAVLSLKVLGMPLMLGDRPGQMLYLMLIAAVCSNAPFGYHLCSNLLHAANVALLFVLLRRLLASEAGLTGSRALKAQLAAVIVTLIFALHPIVVEPVASVNYSSDLLVTFFTLLAMLAATAFRPENFRVALVSGAVGVLCAFAAVTCKESGAALPFLLVVYWFLFHRKETRGPWLWFLGMALTVTALFLAARFHFAPHDDALPLYPGGSFAQVFWVQSKLWTFMMGQLLWPVRLSADYTLENACGIAAPVALIVLLIVIALQAWLAAKSRLGALGVATYWLGLATVSNFIPLYRIMADRYYYLPLAGVAMQLLALLLLTLNSRWVFWLTTAALLGALLPLALLAFTRQQVFANELSLWTDTVQVSPSSSLAHYCLGVALSKTDRVEEEMIQYQLALDIDPSYAKAYNNFGNALLKKGQVNEAIIQYLHALECDPRLTRVHSNLGTAFYQAGRLDQAIAQYREALTTNPDDPELHLYLGNTFLRSGQLDEAISQYEETLHLRPGDARAQNNLAQAQVLARQRNEQK